MKFGLSKPTCQKGLMKTLTLSLLLVAIIFGSFLRLYGLSISPPSVNWDEAALGYNAYSLGETGRDEYGVFLPLFSKSFGEYKAAIPMYLMIPSIKFFGLNEIGVRFSSAFLGVLSILLVYLVVFKMTNKKSIALAAAFVFAIEPWAVSLSRVYEEANTAFFFFLMGFLLYLYSRTKPYLLIGVVISFTLAVFSYNAQKLMIPLFVLGFLWLDRQHLLKLPQKIKTLLMVAAGLIALLALFLTINGQFLARAQGVSIFVLWQGDLYRFLWDLGGRFLAYFSPFNLFIREVPNFAGTVAGVAPFYMAEFLFWGIGLIVVIKEWPRYKYLILLMVVSPIPAVLTREWFSEGRVMTLFVAFSILIGIGVVRTLEWLPGKLRWVGASGLLAFSVCLVIYLADCLFIYTPFRDAGSWQPGFRETVPTVMELSKNYDKVVVHSPHAQPYIFYLFYGKYSPQLYQSQGLSKFEFRNVNWNEDRGRKNTLFVESTLNTPSEGGNGPKILKHIKVGDSEYILVEVR